MRIQVRPWCKPWVKYLLCGSMWFIFGRQGGGSWLCIGPPSHIIHRSSRGSHGQVFQHIVVDLCRYLPLLNNLPPVARLLCMQLIIKEELWRTRQTKEYRYSSISYLFNCFKCSPILTEVPVLLFPVALFLFVRILAQPVQQNLHIVQIRLHEG